MLTKSEAGSGASKVCPDCAIPMVRLGITLVFYCPNCGRDNRDCDTLDCELRQETPCFFWGIEEEACLNASIIVVTKMMEDIEETNRKQTPTGNNDVDIMKAYYMKPHEVGNQKFRFFRPCEPEGHCVGDSCPKIAECEEY